MVLVLTLACSICASPCIAIPQVDIIGNKNSCVFDSKLTSVIGKMVKVVGWYDNEVGYSNRLIDLIEKIN